MGFRFGDRVLETTTTTGTGTITLLGAVAGYQTFATFATLNGDKFPYAIVGSTEWEVGIGTRTGASTFTRDVITASSNAGAVVTFSAGTKEVWMDNSAALISTGGRCDNIVINGGMEVSQESIATAQTGVAAPTTGSGRTIVDQFYYASFSTAAVVTLQQVTDAPAGFDNSLKVTCTTADAAIAAGDLAFVEHIFEGYRVARLKLGSASASSFSLGFWVKARLTGTYCVSFQNAAANRSYIVEYTINATNTWEYKTVVIPGETTGTWQTTNAQSLYINWMLIAGSTYQSTANSWLSSAAIATSNQVNGLGTAGGTPDTFQLTGVNLVPGSVPVSQESSPYMVKPFNEELMLCQRYYEKSYDYTVALGASSDASCVGIASRAASATATAGFAVGFPYKVRKRTAPTITLYDTLGASGKIHIAQGGSLQSDTGSTSRVGEGWAGVFTTAATGLTTGEAIETLFHYVLDARL